MEYEKIKVVGEETFGQVMLARKNRMKYVLKRMSKSRGRLSVTTIRQIQLLRAIDHPNVVRLIVVVEEGN